MKFAMQTAVLPELDRLGVVRKLQAHGYDGVEWRVHEDYHVAPSELPGNAAAIRSLVADHGLEVACMMTYLPLADLDAHRRVAEACAILGCPRYRPGAMLYDDSRPYAELQREAIAQLAAIIDAIAPLGVKPVIETHFGTLAPSASLARRLVEHFSPTQIGVNFDPANMIIEGREDWRMALDFLGPYLDYVHVKNIAWIEENGRWRWVFTALGEGQVDWREIMRLLRAAGYDGYLSFENFYRVPMTSKGYIGEDLVQRVERFRDIDQRLAEDLAFIQQCRQGES
ncbi:MAG: sugar phosphate isomerase/epimerase family protein [Gammaproteobacteria bacterium]